MPSLLLLLRAVLLSLCYTHLTSPWSGSKTMAPMSYIHCGTPLEPRMMQRHGQHKGLCDGGRIR